MQNTQIGLDHLLLLQNRFQHYRIGLVTNNAAFTSASEPGQGRLVEKRF